MKINHAKFKQKDNKWLFHWLIQQLHIILFISSIRWSYWNQFRDSHLEWSFQYLCIKFTSQTLIIIMLLLFYWSQCVWTSLILLDFWFFFFCLGNQSLLHKKNSMFTMVKTLCYTNTRDTNGRRKLEMEIHCVKPQILDHWNKVPISKDFKTSANLKYLQ